MSESTPGLSPDLNGQNGLIEALQASLTRLGSKLTVWALAEKVNFASYAKVESGKRFSQVELAAEAFVFSTYFGKGRNILAKARTSELDDTARAIERWVSSNCTTTELIREFTFVRTTSTTKWYEEGEDVVRRWQSYLKAVNDRFPDLASFIQVASEQPELSQLYPFNNYHSFCFSRCTGYPFTMDTPYVTPSGDGQYHVFSPNGMLLGHCDADAAVRMVVENLPPNCGPAIPGTAEEVLS